MFKKPTSETQSRVREVCRVHELNIDVNELEEQLRHMLGMKEYYEKLIAKFIAKLPSSNAVETAIKHIQSSIKSHEQWRDYRKTNGKDNPEYGDLAHHEQCLIEYAEVIVVLDATLETVKTMKTYHGE